MNIMRQTAYLVISYNPNYGLYMKLWFFSLIARRWVRSQTQCKTLIRGLVPDVCTVTQLEVFFSSDYL